ncbi:MAG: MlaD family protein, partial [Planctomycetaceae bacterium]
MDDKEMEFRVGVFVAIATCVAAFMVFHFSELSESFRSSKMVSVHFRDAGGLHSSSPVRMSGIQIGSVRDIRLDEVNGGVLVQLAIQEKYTIRQGSQPRITSSVLGDSAIDFTPGVGTEPIEANTIIPGVAASGPMESIANLEDRVGRALDVFTQTGREWGRVGASMNKAVSGTDGRQMNRVMNATLASLEEFTRTMRTASQTLQSAQGVLADSATQDGLRATLDALPKLVNDTRQAIQAVRVTVQRVDRNMQHLDTAIEPIAA